MNYAKRKKRVVSMERGMACANIIRNVTHYICVLNESLDSTQDKRQRKIIKKDIKKMYSIIVAVNNTTIQG